MPLVGWVIAGLMVATVLLVRTPPEPEYQGIKLSDWAKNYPRNQPQADKAMRAIGTNALPWLIEWLPDEPPPRWKQKVLKQMAKLPSRVGGNYAKKALMSWYGMNRFQFASQSFRDLGKNARPAIPDLVRIACNPKYQQGGKAAAYILIGFHEESLPGLITVLLTSQAPGRRPAIDYFRWNGVSKLGTNANAAVEALVLCLVDNDPLTRNDAVFALAKLAVRADVAVPALAKSVADPDAQVRSLSLAALAVYGDLAHSAAPVVRKALDDPDQHVREMARYALDQVDIKSK